jgi:hypothetical protein
MCLVDLNECFEHLDETYGEEAAKKIVKPLKELFDKDLHETDSYMTAIESIWDASYDTIANLPE